jgi:hypothetical protein
MKALAGAAGKHGATGEIARAAGACCRAGLRCHGNPQDYEGPAPSGGCRQAREQAPQLP